VSAKVVEVTTGRRKLFEDELKRIVRRANRLRAALEGSVDVKAVEVGRAKVEAHTRAPHVRYIMVRR